MIRLATIILTTMLLVTAGLPAAMNNNDKIESKVKQLLSKMTLEEKIGQLVQYSGMELTGPQGEKIDAASLVRQGKVGSFLNITGVKNTKEIQKIAIEESRLKIPLLFGLDVIHGYKTIFPVPLATASSWDLEMLEKIEQIAADEATASGVTWAFSPMVNVARDPRWGRVVEGYGEDTFLTTKMGLAVVKGLQGKSLSDKKTILACIKHYVAYGLVQAGREYWTVSVSDRELWTIYMPAYKAAVDAGVGSIMPAFTSIDSVPMTANKKLVYDILRNKWNFKGIAVSDWNAVLELIPHGVAKDSYQCAELAMDASVDVDMVSGSYANEIPKLIKDKKITMQQIDDAVSRVLRKKFELGLFSNPYLYNDLEREEETVLSKSNLNEARKAAQKSIVLLKNRNNLLPLSKDIKRIAVIGPLADDKTNPLGPWIAKGVKKSAVSVLQGINKIVSRDTEVLYARGSNIDDNNKSMFKAAVNTASRSDIIIAVVGESADMSGEAASRADINLPGVQKDLLKALYNTGIPVIAVLMNGRPLTINWSKTYIPAILETWFLGSEAGNAIADVIFGDYNPSGKLPITFPYCVGQIPIYYNYKQSGRPETLENAKLKYESKYIDIPNTPLFPFGHGLSYTSFKYSEIKLSKNKIKSDESLTVTIELTNTGKVKGVETVQLYIHDRVATVTHPVKELKGFKQVSLEPGKTKKVSFNLNPSDLELYNQKMEKVIEPGMFDVYIGTNSVDVKKTSFEVVDK